MSDGLGSIKRFHLSYYTAFDQKNTVVILLFYIFSIHNVAIHYGFMKLRFIFRLSFLIVICFSCNKKPYNPPYEVVGGYVIGKERCHSDTTQDNWLIDLSVVPLNNNKFGDTLNLNGLDFYHVVKTNQLASQFKFYGAKVAFHAHISSTRISSSNCDLSAAVTFPLKEMQVLYQAELR